MNDTLEDKEPLLASYQSSPSPSPEPQSKSESESDSDSESEPTDAKFTQPPVSPFKRTSFLILLAILSWLAYSNVFHAKKNPKIIHASRPVMLPFLSPFKASWIKNLFQNRYSKDYKFRPAASPVITETLKDGRVRLRGALPEPAIPTAPPVAKKKRKPKAGKASGRKSKPRAVNQRKKVRIYSHVFPCSVFFTMVQINSDFP